MRSKLSVHAKYATVCNAVVENLNARKVKRFEMMVPTATITQFSGEYKINFIAKHAVRFTP